MEWREARDTTVAMWRDIRASIGTAHPTDLLTEINVVCDLCAKAAEESPETARCSYCVAYQQFGGCHGASRMMGEAVVQRDWDRVRELVDGFIARLEDLRLPPEGAGGPA